MSNRVSIYSLLVELGWKEAEAAGKQEEAGEGYAVPFIRAISDTSPTRKLNVKFLQARASEPLRRRPQPSTTDSGVQLPQRRHLRDVGGKRPGEPILAKQPAGH